MVGSIPVNMVSPVVLLYEPNIIFLYTFEAVII